MIFYVLLTHGAKPFGSAENHPAARAQLANLKAFRAEKEPPVEGIIADYQRKVTGLASLPKLSGTLDIALNGGGGLVVMDNIARLFAACDARHRRDLLMELLRYKAHFLGLRQGGLLSHLNETQLKFMASGRETTRYTYGGTRPRNNLSKAERQMQTADAALASRIARGQAADEKAHQLDTIRRDLARKHENPTFRMIAEEANSQGITTTRGGTWSSSTVGRSLGRLDISSQTETLNAGPTQDQDQE